MSNRANFIAVDVETANADMSSICQIGIAQYRDGELAEEWVTYVNPNDYFASINISIHGINKNTVKNSPVFGEVADIIYAYFDNSIVVCHTHFDRVAVKKAFDKIGLRQSYGTWLDTAKVARRTWVQFSRRGYGLGNICEYINYEFKHHDALEDAKACANVLINAMEVSGTSLEDWLVKANKPITQTWSSSKCSANKKR